MRGSDSRRFVLGALLESAAARGTVRGAGLIGLGGPWSAAGSYGCSLSVLVLEVSPHLGDRLTAPVDTRLWSQDED